MFAKEFADLFSFVAWPAVNKQSNFVEPPDDLLAVFDELFLSFLFEKSVN